MTDQNPPNHANAGAAEDVTARPVEGLDGENRPAPTSPQASPGSSPGSSPDGDADRAPDVPASAQDVRAVGERVDRLHDLVTRRLLEDRQRERMYDELYRQLEFARKGLADEYLAPIARELLLVIDRLDALAPAAGAQGSAPVGQELESVRAELAEVLARRGLREVDASGEVFDPRVHEAVGRRVDPERAGRVVEVRRPGYALGDRLIRPAQVVVGYAG